MSLSLATLGKSTEDPDDFLFHPQIVLELEDYFGRIRQKLVDVQ